MSAFQHRRVLVGCDSAEDALLICDLLRGAFPYVESSVEPASLTEHFDRLRPQVLLLAFKQIDAAQRAWAALHEQSVTIAALPHRTVLLCDKRELRLAYQLCCDLRFDDYVLFWPLAHDATRLPMSVHHALRALDDTRFATLLHQVQSQALRIADIEAERDALQASLLAAQLAKEASTGSEVSAVSVAASPPQAPARPLLLLVDDDAFLSKLLARTLRDAGYEVVTAASGSDAIATAQSSRPALVLMDVMLPDMDGMETTRRLKSLGQCAGVPVIMLTGHSHKQVIIESRAAGAVDFLVKPIEREKLLMKVARYLPPAAAHVG